MDALERRDLKGRFLASKQKNTITVLDHDHTYVTGMLFCGLGETVLNNLFAALNLPYVSPTTFKKRERETGIVFEAVADKTCDDVILEEKRKCEEHENYTASFDDGWQTRWSGRIYASLSGHGRMIGHHSGKLLAYSVRSKKCRSYEQDLNNNDHDCRKNWDKSAKAMESDMAIEMLHGLNSKGLLIKNLIMDNVSTTIVTKNKKIIDQIFSHFR